MATPADHASPTPAARLTCPWSGLLLSKCGEAGPDRLSCSVCDCFGYEPETADRDVADDARRLREHADSADRPAH